MSHIIPPPSILDGIRNGKVTMWHERVKPQPVHSDLAIALVKNELWHKTSDGFVDCAQDPIKLPHALNKAVAVKEARYVLCSTDRGFYGDGDPVEVVIQGYDSYGSKPTEIIGSQSNYWAYRSPATMPLSAVRTWVIPTEVRAVRVQEVDRWHMYELGYIDRRCSLHHDTVKNCMTKRFGSSFYDSNGWIFLYTIKLKQ